jgi:hypothetical protein
MVVIMFVMLHNGVGENWAGCPISFTCQQMQNRIAESLYLLFYLLSVIGSTLSICYLLKALLWIFTGSSLPAAAEVCHESAEKGLTKVVAKHLCTCHRPVLESNGS